MRFDDDARLRMLSERASSEAAKGCSRAAVGNEKRALRSTEPEVMKAVVRANQNNAGIYATVTRIGELAVGQSMFLHR